jgi:putative SOS response-associated peptidase YedK
LRWGLIPHFARGNPGPYSTINARVETLRSSPAYRDAWLTGTPEAAFAVLRSYPDELRTAWPVSRKVNSVRNNDPTLIEALGT